ncbi:DinB family protein [Agriterribacter sp.]|uniref:DinB family protein n=1 Tax=Agriterribacter sp. TaxID=2821509 RepID=UPI002CFEF3CD|nr:DinB family protein [Agriterribacter sp.]HRO44318.1 DinB family protein [Agriterribacter sp.]HRQ16634.1 DinB family protein [Agriterribacter sp.]
MTDKKHEVWLRGPVDGIPALLQPVAHALLQAREEINALMDNFPETLLWEKPAGVASPGFHLQHIKGVIDRLLTYARGEMLNAEQLSYLKQEEHPPSPSCKTSELLALLNLQVDKALAQLSATDESTLTAFRGVGRAQLPSTVLGLLMHAAEHTQRHNGQLLVTVRMLKAGQV